MKLKPGRRGVGAEKGVVGGDGRGGKGRGVVLKAVSIPFMFRPHFKLKFKTSKDS